MQSPGVDTASCRDSAAENPKPADFAAECRIIVFRPPAGSFAMPSLSLPPSPRETTPEETTLPRCRIFIEKLRIEARLGAYDWEKGALQPVMVDLTFGLPSCRTCRTDRLEDTIDYAQVVARLQALAVDRHYQLVEAMADRVAAALQHEFGMPWLRLRLSKLAPFPGAEVGIVVERGAAHGAAAD